MKLLLTDTARKLFKGLKAGLSALSVFFIIHIFGFLLIPMLKDMSQNVLSA